MIEELPPHLIPTGPEPEPGTAREIDTAQPVQPTLGEANAWQERMF
jgi:hypothetical protein